MLEKEDFVGYTPENIYLDNAASTLAIKPALQAGLDFLKTYGSIHRGAGHNSEVSTDAYEKDRETIKKYINGTKNDSVIFTGNTTEGVNMLAHILKPKDGGILVSDIEHSSNLLPWMTNFKNVRVFETNEGHIDPEKIDIALDKNLNIQLVACTWASNISGYVTDMQSVYDVCKKHGVMLLADASQYAPHFCPTLEYCDFLVYCGHKMHAPFGCGVLLAGTNEILDRPGTSMTGGGNVAYTSESATIYKHASWMHEAGTPNGFGAITLAAAHDAIYSHPDELYLHNVAMNQAVDDAGEMLRKAGYTVWFDREEEEKTPTFLIDFPLADNKAVVSLLGQKIGIYEKPVFCRIGTFCSYKMIEKLKGFNPLEDFHRAFPDLSEENGIYTTSEELPARYSFIRLSAVLVNSENDVGYAAEKLCRIAEILKNKGR